MNLIRLSIERPIAVVAAVLMVIMFGLLALQTIPIQLTPDVRQPVITITTIWPGAAPAEVEREIVIRQEEVLTGLTGLEQMVSQAQLGQGGGDADKRAAILFVGRGIHDDLTGLAAAHAKITAKAGIAGCGDDGEVAETQFVR